MPPEGSGPLASVRDATTAMQMVATTLNATTQSDLQYNYTCLFATYQAQGCHIAELKAEKKWLQAQVTSLATGIGNLSSMSFALSTSVQMMASIKNNTVDGQRHDNSSGSSEGGGNNSI